MYLTVFLKVKFFFSFLLFFWRFLGSQDGGHHLHWTAQLYNRYTLDKENESETLCFATRPNVRSFAILHK